MRLLVVMDDPAVIVPTGDTTLVVIEACRERGHTVEICPPEALWLDGDALKTRAARVLTTDRVHRPALQVAAPEERAASDYDLVFVRKDPPFDLAYFTATLLLDRALGQVPVVNAPRALRDWNEKLAVLRFPALIAPTIVTRDLARLRQFLAAQGDQMVIKPLDGAGGMGIFHVRAEDRNTNAILETATELGRKPVMAQRYLPAARQGDKRILLLDGEPLGAVLRVPREDETRGNLHVGGRADRTELTPRELEICRAVGPVCRAEGLHLVGLDVIGDHLTEINVTSPTGVQEIDRLDGVKLEDKIVDHLERVAARHG
jgi:glutathione synthase